MKKKKYERYSINGIDKKCVNNLLNNDFKLLKDRNIDITISVELTKLEMLGLKIKIFTYNIKNKSKIKIFKK